MGCGSKGLDFGVPVLRGSESGWLGLKGLGLGFSLGFRGDFRFIAIGLAAWVQVLGLVCWA